MPAIKVLFITILDVKRCHIIW